MLLGQMLRIGRRVQGNCTIARSIDQHLHAKQHAEQDTRLFQFESIPHIHNNIQQDRRVWTLRSLDMRNKRHDFGFRFCSNGKDRLYKTFCLGSRYFTKPIRRQ